MKTITVVEEVVTTREKTLKMPEVFEGTHDTASCVEAFNVSECPGISCGDCMLAKENRSFLTAALQQLAKEE